jgi:DNA-directed RNA polymerase subunit M/transcription elongation factor TFIIS
VGEGAHPAMVKLDTWSDGIESSTRFSAILILNDVLLDWGKCEMIESAVAATMRTRTAYIDRITQLCHNLKHNTALRKMDVDSLIILRDGDLSKNTVSELFDEQESLRKERFDALLQEKYELLNDKQFSSSLVCRKCGSPDVKWEQKQTRGADEAMTIFCTCTICNNRWKMS